MKLEKLLGLHRLMAEAGEGEGGGGAGGEGAGGEGAGGEGAGGEGEGGGHSLSWDDLVSAEVKEQYGNVLENAKTPDDLVKQFANAQSMIGRSVRIPGEDASDDQRREFLDKLKGIDGVVVTGTGEDKDKHFRESMGVPEKPEDYKVDLSKLPEGVEIPQSELDQQRKLWHELGLSPEQAQKAADAHFERYSNDVQAFEENSRQAKAELQRELGAAYEEKMVSAKYTMNTLLDKDTAEYIRSTPLIHNTQFIKAMAAMGEKLKDDGSVSAARRQELSLTPEEAKERIAEIQGNPAYLDANHPEHKSLVMKAQKYYAMAYPS